jgi:putative tryptophan/tyrosine transport system substrate-binding protein
MLVNLSRLALGMIFIALASAVLLLSDSKLLRGAKKLPRIAVVQHASTPVLDEGVRGMVDGLAAEGFVHGETADLVMYNAEGDVTTANTIAQDVVNGDFDVVITSSTPSMQAVANANRDGKVVQVFGLVADPFSAVAGLDKNKPLQHPRHLIGLGTFSPVGESFRIARQCLPALQTVGVVWNPAESNSQAFVGRARVVCKEMGIDLIEANADSASGVQEACQSLIGRGAQGIWMGGDNTVNSAIAVLVGTATRGRLPVFSILPGKPDRGTFFDVGNDFYEVGLLTGKMAAQVLRGVDPATLEVRDVADVVPVRIHVDTLVLEGLKDPWHAPEALLKRADAVVDQTGIHTRKK